ncbi:WD repeat-containing protein 87-like isoform X4 [Ostrea edulis]|uniref:WD repeat-containing protein 87-like isoform X4 n=1 Tax=Ostrea edulis TaxID=37623 RepID=UPI0024AFAA1A|nr:WD repeat-containing protein 87-like isoform X4 [Ostrea edulis]
MLKSVLICSLFLVCMQNETTSRRKRQFTTPNSSVINLTGSTKIIRRTNVSSHDLCVKLCGEEKLIKCQYFKYVDDQKLCYLSERDQLNIAVSGFQPNSTVDDRNAVFNEKKQLQEFAEFLHVSEIKDADRKQRPKILKRNTVAKETMDKGRHKRQSPPNSSVVKLPGNIRIIRKTNVSSHDLCAKLCAEERVFKCQYFKYVDDQKLCYLSERDQPNIAVSGLPPNTTPDHRDAAFSEEKHQKHKLQEIAELLSRIKVADQKQKPKVLKLNSMAIKPMGKASAHISAKSSEEEQQKRKLQEIAELLSKMKDASQNQRPVVVNLNPTRTKMPTNITNTIHKKTKETAIRLKNIEKDLANIQDLRDKILHISKTVVGNFTKIKEMQIRSLLHFNKRMHNLNKDLLKATKDIRSIKASMNELQIKTSDKKVKEDIASLQKSRDTFDATLRKLEGRSANLHNDISLFHQLMIIIAKKIDVLNKQSRNDAKMQKFQAVAVKSMEELHQHGKKIRKQIKRLEHNIKLVAHAVILSQIGETKSKSMIEKINKELQDLKKAVQTSYVWQNVENLGGFSRREQSPEVSKEIHGLLQKLKTYVGRLNEANNKRFQIMNKGMNKFLQRTVELVAKMERRSKWLVGQRVEKLQQVLVESLKSFSRWTRKEKGKVKSLDKKISDLTLETSRISDGSQNFEKDNHELKEKLNRIRKKEKSLVQSLKNVEKSNLENSAKLRGDLRNAIKKAMDKKSKMLTKKTESKVQTAMTAAEKVNRKLEKMRRKEDKKLKETKAKLDQKVKGVMKKVSEKVALDKSSADTNIKLQAQKKQIQRALAKLKAIGKSQYSKLNEKVEAIMNEKTGSVNDKVDRKLAKIKDAVRHTIESISATEDTDHKQLEAVQKKIGRFLNEVKDIEKTRQKENVEITRAEEEKRTDKVNKLLAATAKKAKKMQQKIAKKSQQKVRKLKKEIKIMTDKVMENVSEQKRKGAVANKILKANRLKLGRKLDELKQEMKYKKKFSEQREQEASLKANKILKEKRLKLGRKLDELKREMKYKKKFSEQREQEASLKANKVLKEKRLKLGRKLDELKREMKYKKKFSEQREQEASLKVKKIIDEMKKVSKLKSDLARKEEELRKQETEMRKVAQTIKEGKEAVTWKKKKHPKMKVIPDDGKHRKLPKGAIKIPVHKKPESTKEIPKQPIKRPGKKKEKLRPPSKGREAVTWKKKKHQKMKVIPDDGKHRELPEGAVKVPVQKTARRKKTKKPYFEKKKPKQPTETKVTSDVGTGRKLPAGPVTLTSHKQKMAIKKKFPIKIFRDNDRIRKLPAGAVKVAFQKRKIRLGEKLVKVTKEYKIAKRKELKIKKKLKMTIKEEKSLSSLQVKSYKEKKLVEKQKKQLKKKIITDRKNYKATAKKVRRMRERKKDLERLLETQKPKKQKGKTIKIIPDDGGKRKLPKGSTKVAFQKANKILKENRLKLGRKLDELKQEMKYKKKFSEQREQEASLKANKMLKANRLKLGRKVDELKREMKYKKKFSEQREQEASLKPKKQKGKTIKIIPDDGGKRKLPKGSTKVAFQKLKTKQG